MQIRLLADETDFIVVEKPCGFRTHKVSESQLGFVEVLSEKLNQPLWVVHRLDKETSGLMVFAKSAEAAKNLSELFEKKEVQKTYYFLTDRQSPNLSFQVESHIEKSQNLFRNVEGKTANAYTELSVVESLSGERTLVVWKAQPITGKPHQIRLHATQSGIAILGDLEHGGTAWYRLGLHAGALSFIFRNNTYTYESPLPESFKTRLHPLRALLEDSWQQVHQIYSVPRGTCYRLVHSQKHLKADVYGDVLWVYWYFNEAPTEFDLQQIAEFSDARCLKHVVRHMINRGTGVGGRESKDLYFSPNVSEKWTAVENDLQFELRREAGFSPGLFLDQRENRHWVIANSKNRTVLNLFSYTSGFSVAALHGEAKQTTTVDASANFLEWSKENFRLNNLNAEESEFFAQDSLIFLKGSQKRNRNWDLIICDPPSFGRTKSTTWKIEKDLPELIELMWYCLNKKGQILFTCNYEKWTLMDLRNVFEKSLKGQKFEIRNVPSMGLDFELPDAYHNLTKGFIITRL